MISLTGHPDLFFDRVDKGDEVWQQTLDNPQDKVEFMLVEDNDADLILDRYPGALDGDVPFLEPVVQNERYTLLRVTDSTNTTTSTTAAATARARTTRTPSRTRAATSAPLRRTASRPRPAPSG